ncbi:kinase-like domain-containing protein [Hypoxylon sp. NC1633]|nr:kinase-like domain-containing protein [Hypoxylon sp. NC1633]
MSIIRVTKWLPTTPEDISADWLRCVLRRNVQRIEVTSTVLDQTAGKVFVNIEYDNGSQEALCLKGSFNPEMMAMEGYGDILEAMYTREVDFFNHVAPTLTAVRLPKVRWAGANTKQPQAIVVMEDLTKHGYTFGSTVATWSIDRVKAGVEQLAALHAVPNTIKNKERTVAAIKKHFTTKNPRFIYLIHSNPPPSNTFINQNDNPSFLDWQTIHISAAFYDLAYFVIGTLSIANQRKHKLSILTYYLKELAKFGGPRLSTRDEKVMEEYKKSMMAGME